MVYYLTCQCNSFSVGKTKLGVHKRAYILSKTTANPEPLLGRHVRDQLLLLLLLQREARWIAKLGATFPPGLNTQLSYRPFLEVFVKKSDILFLLFVALWVCYVILCMI